jgi:hypothetical protein
MTRLFVTLCLGLAISACRSPHSYDNESGHHPAVENADISLYESSAPTSRPASRTEDTEIWFGSH